eukprot:TRINITY_DN639_c0_g1_i8.p2 TRINITY_DN639_c0_g1~~TRINITY_DN639_c0_g1_i8.p2  ORF type:complete len:104 (+),score=9.59 TRINITY_DN639_c0_g1_i8:281-592(+)
MAAATRVLSSELSKLSKHPVPGFVVEPSCDDLFAWNVGIFGPPNTLYEGAYFRAKLTFPKTYPMEPPAFAFLTEMWHPNIFPVTHLISSPPALQAPHCLLLHR